MILLTLSLDGFLRLGETICKDSLPERRRALTLTSKISLILTSRISPKLGQKVELGKAVD